MGILIQIGSLLFCFIVRCSWTFRGEQGLCFLICSLELFWASWTSFTAVMFVLGFFSQQNFTSVVLGNTMLRDDCKSSVITNTSFCLFVAWYAFQPVYRACANSQVVPRWNLSSYLFLSIIHVRSRLSVFYCN